MSTTQNFLTLCTREQFARGAYFGIRVLEDALCLDDGVFAGIALLPPVDSGEAGFRWSRVRLNAEIPGQSGIHIFARASDDGTWPEWDALAAAEKPDGALLREVFGPPASSGTEAWLSLSGRRLWLALELTGSGPQRPRVDAVSLRMEGDHMADYLPAIYQEQDFTYRFLSIFSSMFQDLEEEIESFPRQLDPDSAAPEMLEYLSQWLCMEPEKDPELLRRRFPGILEEYETMYTRAGVMRSVERLTGVKPWLIEHFMVDPNSPDCADPALYRRLYGENPYRFFLLLPQRTFAQQAQMERFIDQMRELIPAETEFELVLLKPCIQLDWHTYLGINSRIGDYIPAGIDESVTIHYDTTIGGDGA